MHVQAIDWGIVALGFSSILHGQFISTANAAPLPTISYPAGAYACGWGWAQASPAKLA